MYTEVKKMKKTEGITYRTDKVLKKALQTVADEKRWTISQLTEIIVREWMEKNYPELLEESE